MHHHALSLLLACLAAQPALADRLDRLREPLTEGLLIVALEEQSREEPRNWGLSPISVTDLGVIRQRLGPESDAFPYYSAAFAGWANFHREIERAGEHGIAALVGPDAAKAELITSFDGRAAQIRRITFADPAAAVGHREQIRDSFYSEVRSPDRIAFEEHVGWTILDTEGRQATISDPRRADALDGADLAGTAAADRYLATLDLTLDDAEQAAPGDAMAVELTVSLHGNLTEPGWTPASPVPEGAGTEPGGLPPYFGVVVVDWRMPNDHGVVTVGLTHTGPCEADPRAGDLLRERWDTTPILRVESKGEHPAAGSLLGPVGQIRSAAHATDNWGEVCITTLTTSETPLIRAPIDPRDSAVLDEVNLVYLHMANLFKGGEPEPLFR